MRENTFNVQTKTTALSFRLEALPVFRHGSEAARICDEALSVSGPTDPRITKLIQSDQNAQMAYHIHKALGFALEVSCRQVVKSTRPTRGVILMFDVKNKNCKIRFYSLIHSTCYK